MKKEEEIARLLSQGTQPTELVRKGYNRSTVYKVARRERTPTPQDPASPIAGAADLVADAKLEADPEIMERKKAVRMAQLDLQLAEIRAPIDLEARLVTVEEHVAALLEAVTHLVEDIWGVPFTETG